MTRLAPLAALLALGACATAEKTSFNSDIPGVAAQEASFFSGTIRNVYRGDNDIIFVRAAGRWYRTALNEGCLDSIVATNPTFIFDSQGTSKVDRFTRVHVVDGGGMPLQCQVRSIRQSLAPQMVDASSIVPRG
ncbi:DUF6491 family protein [Sphingomicrobium clamense]|uniref:Lipoprotein n=1 Tax=Sphingomicrobium clamense TaxID=2851013 RepID=A0ABS6V7Q0_9SPHN|nr:DUF6491 family protein [Sphingomicrobium sp. B8]MBW0145604.1 hypothetical protein [Sphingomicrobium sp. B8]